jgi:hypothetical protein
MMKIAIAAIAGCALLTSGCATVKDNRNAHSYLGTVVDKTEDVDLAPHPHPWGKEVSGADELWTKFGGRHKYRRYTVALEQGEKISLRAKAGDIGVSECVRVWIYGPGVSPAYLYEPDYSAIEKASGCKL